MNEQEAIDWTRKATDRFPGLKQLFEGARDPKGVAVDWAHALRNVPLEAAERYLLGMVAGDIDPPKYTSDWATLPGQLRRWCAENSPLQSQVAPDRFCREPRYKCLACRDRGYGVEVFNPRWIDAQEVEIAAGLPADWERTARRWCQVNRAGPLIYGIDCSCERGRQLHASRRSPGERYEPGRHCLVPGGPRSELPAVLRQWVEEHPVLESEAVQFKPRMSYDEVVGAHK